jgi:hypothetical protein
VALSSLVGSTLGKYQLVELIGKGGMATVYKGLQTDVDRFVAIKVLPPHPGQDATYVERFRQEARTIARLQHPHIVPLYDYGSERDVLYLVTPFISGGSLSSRIRRGALPLETVDTLVGQIASALDYAHRNGVIHRDIKPDNVLLNDDDFPLLSDFGIAKLVESSSASLTGTGGLIGTPAYMSPEQAQGLPVDTRSDLYSLGVVTFEMLTGRQPYHDETAMQIVMKHINAPVPSLREAAPNVSEALDAVLMQALAKEPDARFQTASAFASALHIAVQDQEEPLNTVALSPAEAAAVRARTTPPPARTASPAVPAQDTQSATPSTTIVVREAGGLNNPFVLLGGFALIALLVVAVLLLTRPQVAGPIAQDATPSAAARATAATVISRPTALPSFGGGFFSTASTLGDSINVRVTDLPAPPAGGFFAAWLVDSETGDTLSLGRLTVDPNGDGQLTYTSDDGLFLPGAFDTLLITGERSVNSLPAGTTVYVGQVPSAVSSALHAVLVETSSPEADGKPAYRGSLLSGALNEAEIARNHAGLAAGATTPGSMHTHNEHTINILNGTRVDYDGSGEGQNPGLGYGLGYFLDRIDAALNEAVGAASATAELQAQAELIRVCLRNATVWRDAVITLEMQFLSEDDVAAVQTGLARSTELASYILDGTDLNGNGTVEPFEGECGLRQIEQYGIAVANLLLRPGDPSLPALRPAEATVEPTVTAQPTSDYDPNAEN